MKINMVIRTFAFYVIGSVIFVICIIPLLLVSILPAKYRYDNPIYFFFTDLFFKGILFATFLPIKVIGRSHLSKTPSIIAANHQSALDIPLVGILLRRYPQIWLFKEELQSTPLVGFVGKRMGVVVDRSTPRRALKTLSDSIKLFDNHQRQLVIFPEGGRYIDGTVHEFLWGFAIIAKKTGRPVVPVYIKNINKAYPPGSFWVHYYPITVVIGKPFNFEPGEEDAAFIKRVHDWFVEQASG